jgi:uncharacterized protein (DUF488 family)
MPWFSSLELERALREAGVGYLHLPELGGRRDPLRGSPNRGWRVGQFQGYADHMGSTEFEVGLERLLALAAGRRTAVMCAEAQWTRCHRRLLADVLVARGQAVLHIGSRGGLERHELTEFASVEDGRLTYPNAQAALDV